MRIAKTGSTYTGYFTEGDQPWTRLGETTLDLGTESYVGMFISANHHSKTDHVGNPAARAEVQFRDLTGFANSVP